MAKQKHDMVAAIDDLAKYVKLSTSTLYKLCADGGVARDLKPGLYVGQGRSLHLGACAGMFLAEALLVGTGRRSLPVLEIERHPAVFPFGTSALLLVI
jgi:hypothetical protein